MAGGATVPISKIAHERATRYRVTTIVIMSHDRAIDDANALERVLRSKLTYDSGAWALLESGAGGRCLVAKRDLPAGAHVFTEEPVVVAYPKADDDLISAVSCKLLDLVCWRLGDERFEPSGDFALICQTLQSAPGTSRGGEDWARSVAKVNAHGAGGTLIDPAYQRRGVLGMMSSMMQHECNPSCVIHIGSPAKCVDDGGENGSDDGSDDGGDDVSSEDGDEGSLMSLHTLREVAAGELLSISYIGAYHPTRQRREQLGGQHGFVCACPRCTRLPELVRAFRCPACRGDGPCSPSSPAQTCRELHCDACNTTTTIDEEAWRRLEATESCECHDEGAAGEEASGWSSCERCRSLLHPYHHKPALRAQRTLRWLSPAGRASQLAQHARARQRLYASFVPSGRPHPLVAVDLENVAIALLAAGDVDDAKSQFAAAARCFAAFYGAASADAMRCTRGAACVSLDEFKRVQDCARSRHELVKLAR